MRPRVLVIAMAEATFDLLLPMAKAGKLPTFSRLMAQGASGPLASQMPMVTPQMCGTVVTGRSPGEHGLMDFWQRGADGRFRETDGTFLRVPPIWRVLSERGTPCAILNVPFTYPPEEIEGVMISGEDAPGAHPSIAHPRSLYGELTERFGPYPLKDTFPGGRRKEDYLTLITRDVERQSSIFAHVLREKPWQFGMIFFSHTAMVQHYFWADHASEDAANPFRGVVESAYVALDKAVARLMEAAGPDTNVFVISDSGAGPLYSGVNVNQLLEQRGFLKRKAKPQPKGGGAAADRTRKPGGGAVEALRRIAQGQLQRGWLKPLYFTVNHRLKPLKAWIQSHLSGSSIDWAGTQAYSRGQWGYIYVNLKGRDPHGIVEPGAEYDAVRDRIAAAFEGLVDPQRKEKAVVRVWRREDLYHGPAVDQAPDMVIEWRDGAYMPNEASIGDSVFAPRYREYMSWPTSGSHRIPGILMAAGPAIAAGVQVQGARILDLVPTWMRILGQAPPAGLEGRPLDALSPSQRLAS
jgi:predicted AlkP superfamily phosphohydrolase/phosphomutase